MTVSATHNLASVRGLWGATGVYVLTHRESGRRYVGQSADIGRRMAIHRSGAKRGDKSSEIRRALIEHGIDAFDMQVVDECSADELDELETFAIEFFDATNPDCGFNGRTGGRNGVFVGAALERKTAANIALANDMSWRNRQADGLRSRSKSAEWRANVKAGLRARFGRFIWRHPEHGTEIAGHGELAERHAGLCTSHLSAVARGKLRQHKGWICVGRAEEPK